MSGWTATDFAGQSGGWQAIDFAEPPAAPPAGGGWFAFAFEQADGGWRSTDFQTITTDAIAALPNERDRDTSIGTLTTGGSPTPGSPGWYAWNFGRDDGGWRATDFRFIEPAAIPNERERESSVGDIVLNLESIPNERDRESSVGTLSVAISIDAINNERDRDTVVGTFTSASGPSILVAIPNERGRDSFSPDVEPQVIAPATIEQNIQIVLSGTGNRTPGASLGGPFSDTAMVNQFWRVASPISGVTIRNASGNRVGDGALSFTVATRSLRWTPPGETTGADTPIDVAGGRYALIGAAAGLLLVDVLAGALPAADASATVTISEADNTLFDNHIAGDPETIYRCVHVYNGGAADAAVRLRVVQPAVGSVRVGLDPLTGGNVQSIADETTAPVGVTFDAADIGNVVLPATGSVALWIERSVPSGIGARVATAAELQVLVG